MTTKELDQRPDKLTGLIEPIWERQPVLGETPADYAKFRTYLSIPVQKRTMVEFWRVWQGDETINRVGENYYDLMKQMKWEMRAEAWDDKTIKLFQEDWFEKEKKRRDKEFETADRIRQIALDALATAEAEQKITPTSALKLLELASKMQRESIPTADLEGGMLKGILMALPEDRRKGIIEQARMLKAGSVDGKEEEATDDSGD